MHSMEHDAWQPHGGFIWYCNVVDNNILFLCWCLIFLTNGSIVAFCDRLAATMMMMMMIIIEGFYAKLS